MMPIRSLLVKGYRSVQRVMLQLGRVNVIVGPNGCGKSNLYRSLYLLSVAAEGRLARTLVEEGGMPSCLWAGEKRKGVPKRITIDVRFEQWSYRFACGLPSPAGVPTAFDLDPFVRDEELWFHDRGRKNSIFRRKNGSAYLRDEHAQRIDFPLAISNSESVLSELREPHRFPELSALRSVILGWRFYHHFRTDEQSPLRRSQIVVQTPVLSNDGSDLAAALQTILEIGEGAVLSESIARAFDGAELEIQQAAGRMSIRLRPVHFRRYFAANELSDGTLKYLCLLAALLSPRPPSLLAINEPDANLHPQLYEPLAHLIGHASRTSQLWITTHSEKLAALLEEHAGATLFPLKLNEGATTIIGAPDDPLEDDDSEQDEDA